MKATEIVGGKATTRRAEIRARVYRAGTGKWEDYGVVSSYKLSWRIKNWFKRLFAKL